MNQNPNLRLCVWLIIRHFLPGRFHLSYHHELTDRRTKRCLDFGCNSSVKIMCLVSTYVRYCKSPTCLFETCKISYAVTAFQLKLWMSMFSRNFEYFKQLQFRNKKEKVFYWIMLMNRIKNYVTWRTNVISISFLCNIHLETERWSW